MREASLFVGLYNKEIQFPSSSRDASLIWNKLIKVSKLKDSISYVYIFIWYYYLRGESLAIGTNRFAVCLHRIKLGLPSFLDGLVRIFKLRLGEGGFIVR